MDGMLKFDMSSHSYWPMTLFNPGAMGYLSYLSLLTECNHGVLSMDFRITSGSVKINDRIVDFSGGRGYIEKDWVSCYKSFFGGTHLGTEFSSVLDLDASSFWKFIFFVPLYCRSSSNGIHFAWFYLWISS